MRLQIQQLQILFPDAAQFLFVQHVVDAGNHEQRHQRRVHKTAGTSLMKPVAIVCIGGLVYATLMTLFVVPCIYDTLNKKELRSVREEDLKLLDL